MSSVNHLHNQETSSMPNEYSIFWTAGQQVNDSLTYTATRNQDYTAENRILAFQVAFTGVKQHSQDLFILLLPAPLKNVFQAVSPND